MERDKELVATGEAKGRDILSALMRSRNADSEGRRLSDDVVLDNVSQACRCASFTSLTMFVRSPLSSWLATRQQRTSLT